MPTPMKPVPRTLPNEHIGTLKRIHAKMGAIPEAVTQHDIFEAMKAGACLAFPDDTALQAYAKFMQTKRGYTMMDLYNFLPPDTTEAEPQPVPPTTSAEKKLAALAKTFVQEGKATTVAKGYVMALEQHPHLYTDYLRETT